MRITTTLAALFLATTTFAAEPPKTPPAVPEESIAKKKELLFSDDFEGAEPAKVWHKVVATFAVEKGTLKGTQTRDKNVPAADGTVTETWRSTLPVPMTQRAFMHVRVTYP